MVEHHLTGKSMEERLRDRERNSGDTKNADVVLKPSQGARFHNIHPFGAHGATGTNHPTDGHVDVHPNSAKQGSGGNP